MQWLHLILAKSKRILLSRRISVQPNLFRLTKSPSYLILCARWNQFSIFHPDIVKPAINRAAKGTFPAITALCPDICLKVIGMNVYHWRFLLKTLLL